MSWMLEGKRIKGFYEKQYIMGLVSQTRVSEGAIIHTIKLDTPITVTWSEEKKSSVILDHNMITEVF